MQNLCVCLTLPLHMVKAAPVSFSTQGLVGLVPFL